MIRKALGSLLGCTGESREDRAEFEALRAEVAALRAELAALRSGLAGAPRTVGSLHEAARAMAGGAEVRLDAVSAPAAPTGPAPAAGRSVSVRLEDCIACGTCVEYARGAFALGADGRARVVRQDVPAEELQAAIDACPVGCIRWEG